MVKLRLDPRSCFLLIVFGFLLSTAAARRQQNKQHRRTSPSDLAQSGWTVPLQGAGSKSLTPPSQSSQLQLLAIGRGTITYTCDGRNDNQAPLYVTQNAFLYDAAPLVSKFSSEDQFHSYIPRFLDYDYTSIDNSSLTCIGNLRRSDTFTIFELYNIDAFIIKVKETVNSPNNAPFDLSWAHSQDADAQWDVYRVETASGGPPYNCGDQIISKIIPVEYAAEYWFYQRTLEPQQR